MKNRVNVFILLILSFSMLAAASAAAQEDQRWRQWLDEVDAIMSKAEREVFESLQTEEDRMRFQRAFWAVRDPVPDTRENEYRLEYFQRMSYARKRLGGIKSDRGRIYLILGEPFDRSNYSGSDRVIDCEVWEYRTRGMAGLPAHMTLLFYKPRDVGDYRLFYPGIHSAKDILSPGYQSAGISELQAYREVRMSFPQLAQATLSVIPGEGSPTMPATANSSNYAFSQIFSLPERVAKSSYLNNFRALRGEIAVTTSFRALDGNGSLALSRDRGISFLNYRIMPEAVRTRTTPDGYFSARLAFNLRISDPSGKTIYQRERDIDLKLSPVEKAVIDEHGAVFSDFVPIVDGDFNVTVMFTNTSTEEFFAYEENIKIAPDAVPVILGYKADEVSSDAFFPFCSEKIKIFSDPRSIYNISDSLFGLVFSREKPEIRLANADDAQDTIPLAEVQAHPRFFAFDHPLQDVKPGNYFLIIFIQGRQVYKRLVSVLPFIAKKPRGYEWSDPPTSGRQYNFIQAQQYLNSDRIEEALQTFERLPPDFWNGATIPMLARARYENANYTQVVELLERNDVVKSYPVLLLLGNSLLQLKKLPEAAAYFEELRKYGDSARINRTLGAIYLSLGEREKAQVYFDRAETLEKRKNDLPGQ